MKRLITITTILLLTASCGKYATGAQLAEIANRVNDNEAKINDLYTRLNTIIYRVDTNTNAITSQGIDLYQLQSNLDDMSSRLDLVENDSPRIIDVYKPCPTSKEVLLELDTGELLGYFENGNKRYLSVLEAGNYKTTDGTNCRFTVE